MASVLFRENQHTPPTKIKFKETWNNFRLLKIRVMLVSVSPMAESGSALRTWELPTAIYSRNHDISENHAKRSLYFTGRKRRERIEMHFFWQTLWQTFTPYSDRHVQNKIYLCFLSQWSFMFLANPFIESHYLFNLKFVGGNIKFIETSTSSIKDKLPQPLVVSISNTILFSLEWNKTFSFASSLIFVSCTVRDWLFEILVFTL